MTNGGPVAIQKRWDDDRRARIELHLNRDKQVVPALMFHSVGLENWPWAWSEISEPIETFEAKIALIKDSGFTGIFWDELYDHMAGRRLLPDNCILLTFDDGYLDNWVHVYPVLKKYDMKATIFVNPDFVEHRDELRPSTDDVKSNRIDRRDLQVAGFLSWPEMREMEKSGLIDVQSHALTHTWYFTAPRIVDFHRPHKVTPYPWLFWNARPGRKPYYLNEDQQEFVPWGFPIFEHEKALTARRFFPDENAVKQVTDFFSTHQGDADFFVNSNWREAIERHVARVFDGGAVPGVYETEEARTERITEELQRSKMLIEKNLSKVVDYICWPGGGNDSKVQEIARSVGYKSWTLNSKTEPEKRNRPQTDATTIKRIRSSNRLDVRGRRCGTAGPRFFLWRILEHQGSALHAAAARAYKLAALARTHGGTG